MRVATSLLLALAVAAALLPASRAQNPDIPQGGASCRTDWDCSLGGECTAGACVCDAWFTGPNCDLLNLAQAEIDNGLQVPGYFSWGGHSALDESTGVYHGYFSFMCRHQTLGAWTTASSIIHATAQKPEGPYTWDNLVVPPWAHNTILTRDPSTGKWLIFHIGNGEVDPSQWSPCFTNSSAPSPADEGAGAPTQPPSAYTGEGVFVEISSDLGGPWTSYNNSAGLPFDLSNNPWFSSLSNPTPFIFPNGTTLLFYSAANCPPNWGALAPNCIGLGRADHWSGTFVDISPEHPITHPESEDPFVFQDPRGNFHLLTNVNTYHRRCAQGVPCGGHAWSYDAITWSNLTIGAFGPVIRLVNGSYWYTAYVERPQVLQDKNRVPITFFVGMGRASYEDSCSWAQPFCQAGQTGCGPTVPPSPKKVQYKSAATGGCLATNSTYPCPGGWADSCPVFVGDCASPDSVWLEAQSGLIESANRAGVYINVDCKFCATGTLVKALESDGDQVSFANGQLQYPCGGATTCLTQGSGTPVPPCKAGEYYMQAQIKVAPCSDPSTQGWVRVVLSN